jgi:lipopolysaccharide transport system permease protein
LNVKYRDFRYVVPFMVQFGLYVSPVGFSSTVIPQAWRTLFYLNPMAAVIDGFRWTLLGGTALWWPGQCIGVAVSVVLLVTGLRYFRAVEKGFADVI